jgi:uncharacterized protein YcfL
MNFMKYTLTIAAIALILVSCGGKQQGIKNSERKAKIDSMVAERMQEVNTQAMEDLDRRMSIEVKAKTDSIVQAKRAAQGAQDNTATGPSTQP